MIAKSLIQDPALIIFDEPTRGVDVGAIVEIHELINKLCRIGSLFLDKVRSSRSSPGLKPPRKKSCMRQSIECRGCEAAIASCA